MERARFSAGRRIVLLVALFPSYLFLDLDNHQHERTSLRDVFLATRLLMLGEEPAWVSTAVMAGIFGMLDEEGVMRLPDPDHERFRVGQRVRVREGPLADLPPGKFQRMSGGQRCRVLFQWLGRETVAVVDVDKLEAA
jgi:transcription antitermination factor NusG